MKTLVAGLSAVLLTALLTLACGTVSAEDSEKTFSQEELDQMMAPIALYPDSLLSQILMATTYPADIAEAVTWSKDNPDQKGDAAAEAVQDKSWDPSVMSLAAFPQVLTMMGEQPDWVRNVGDAFLAAPESVMDTVQRCAKERKMKVTWNPLSNRLLSQSRHHPDNQSLSSSRPIPRWSMYPLITPR